MFTSESVSAGHPDKLADSVSDAILDAILEQDPDARVAVETLAANGLIVIAGEVTTEAYVEIPDIVRKRILEIGYDSSAKGFDGASCGITVTLSQQSPEIAGGVFDALEGRGDSTRDSISSQGAGDQGIIFGYANSDNTSYFPAAGKIAHLLAERLHIVRNNDSNSVLLPDSKTQVTLAYEDGIPVGINKVLISSQHYAEVSQTALYGYLVSNVIEPVIEEYNAEHAYGPELWNSGDYLINPAGAWSYGGPGADAGLTGRKIIVDSYNGYARHGGGAYSGKDASKVDRSAAYALRHVAKNLVAAGLAEEVEIQVAYAIGSAEPVSIHVDTKGKRSVGARELERIITEEFDLRPGAIIKDLDLKKPRYSQTSAYGHFGRNPQGLFTWENLDKVQDLKKYV